MAKVYPITPDPENFSYPVGDYRVFRISVTDRESLGFLPKLAVRALQFIITYHAETDAVWLTQLLYQSLTNPQTANLVFVLIAIDQQNEIVGHSISYVDSFGRLGSVALHLQLEIDHCVCASDRKVMRELGRSLNEEWVRSLNLKTILAYTFDESLVRLHKRDGFSTFRVLLRKDLEA